ncbi:alpha/beta hydrolase [Stenomitos frigidus]|uniref:Esterase n=1 Tax=Stenomitos frigidus ULC18 TaxID=2107698 RepID=A0A2T1EC75_9CYAN|nr:alpha/beta hydrolase-fold protein [Stenomitos frigidus]PSB30330.1 esterase [Stenomitos frigidus ULC18]
MKVKPKTILLAGAFFLAAVAGAGYWYVFIAGAPQLDAPHAEKKTGLRLQVETFTSEAMGGDREYGVVLPPDYAQNPKKRYPVIVLLHGGHGTARDYEDKAALTSVLHDLYQQRKLPPTIVITPDGNDQRGTSPLWDPDYFDGPNGQVATLIGSELVQEVKSRYRTLNQPQFWAIGGLSSGGWGAFNIGLRYLDQFHILFSHTGYFISKTGAENSPEVFVEDIPINLRKQLRLYLDAGESDEKFLEATEQFHQTLDRLEIPNEFHVYPGGHGIAGQNVGWNYWHKHLANSLSFVGKQFAIAAKAQRPKHKPLSSGQ